MIRILAFTAVFAALLSPSIRAQDAGSSERGVELRLLAFSPELQQREAYAHDPAAGEGTPGVLAPIKTYLNHQFTAVPLASRKVVFTLKPERESMKQKGELIGEATLPAGTRSAILLFVPAAPGDDAKCRVMVVDDTKQKFPAGSFHITNMSPLPVRLMLERKKYDFNPGKVMLIEDPPSRDTGQIGMRTFVVKEQHLEPVSTGLWPHPGKTRRLMVFFLEPQTEKVQLRAFDDVPPRDRQASANN
ncbi:MAG: hypothetical protein H7A49_02065 [Akkermansiaceae bacterium]|nr:hypothetical protein [Akkermansiaceae bacterium]MCP5542673.1 hypothetical protein [Akkermansiaceae bacterium]